MSGLGRWLLLVGMALLARRAVTSSAGGNVSVLGGALGSCCTAPMTGFYRDGYCVTGPADTGRHVVCAVVTAEFLAFTASRGNDLQTPRLPGFPGLHPGDRWCLCALRWKEAYDAGVAPPVQLDATSAAALKYVTLAQLQEHAYVAGAQAAAVTPAGATSVGTA